MQNNLILFAHYNSEMNQRVHQAAQQLSAEQLTQDRAAFFGSILGTLNHLIVIDILWLQRIAQHPSRFPSLQILNDWPKPRSLNQPMISDLPDWLERRSKIDHVINQFVFEISDADLQTQLLYTCTEGILNSQPCKIPKR